jgi:hypothetical protein
VAEGRQPGRHRGADLPAMPGDEDAHAHMMPHAGSRPPEHIQLTLINPETYSRHRLIEPDDMEKAMPASRSRPPAPLTPPGLAILSLLWRQPMHPYEIRHRIRVQEIDRVMKVTHGTLYSTVDRLTARAAGPSGPSTRSPAWAGTSFSTRCATA